MVPPVLFLLFNRPDLADRVFKVIRDAQPPQLFIAVDGPRPSRDDEANLVLENQRFAEKVDWPCKVHTLFREQNLGCGQAVSQAIDWFFSEVEAGVILEDDCLPDLSFFEYASELLERFQDDERVMMINGTSYTDTRLPGGESYYFSMFDQVWGWASWQRAWKHYDFALRKWPGDAGVVQRLRFVSPLTRWHLNRIWGRVKAGKVDTWDYQWEHTIMSRGGLVITPALNLVSNIGFDGRATHTSEENDSRAERESNALSFPLSHPASIEVNRKFDRIYERKQIMSPILLVKILLKKATRFLKAVR